MHFNFLFDLDQTLLDFHASEHKALKIVLEENGFHYTEDIYDHFKRLNKSLWLEFEKGAITRTELFKTRFENIFEACGGNSSGIDPLQVNTDFIRTMSQNGVLMEGALEFVERLRNGVKDARIYIVSNGATINAEGRIKTTGLDKYIDKTFVSEWMGVAKPAPEFFDMVLNTIGEPKDSCIVIGDSLTSDMEGARRSSLKSVWFMPLGDVESEVTRYDIDYVASDFDELYDVLLSWTSSF